MRSIAWITLSFFVSEVDSKALAMRIVNQITEGELKGKVYNRARNVWDRHGKNLAVDNIEYQDLKDEIDWIYMREVNRASAQRAEHQIDNLWSSLVDGLYKDELERLARENEGDDMSAKVTKIIEKCQEGPPPEEEKQEEEQKEEEKKEEEKVEEKKEEKKEEDGESRRRKRKREEEEKKEEKKEKKEDESGRRRRRKTSEETEELFAQEEAQETPLSDTNIPTIISISTMALIGLIVGSRAIVMALGFRHNLPRVFKKPLLEA